MTRSAITIKGIFLTGAVLFLISTFKVRPANGSNILGVFLSVSQSHLIVHMSVMRALAEKGHNITVVSTLKPKITHPNIATIIIPPDEEQLKEYEKFIVNMSVEKTSIIKSTLTVLSFNQLIMDIQMNALLDERFKTLYQNKDNKFDVAVMGYFLNDFQVAIGGKFDCPIIISWMMQPIGFLNHLVGVPQESSYVPNIYLLTKQIIMDFPERFQNFILNIFFQLIEAVMDSKMEGYYNQFIANDTTLPSFKDMKKNIALVFFNSHYTEGAVRPLPPAAVLIGGIQIKEKPDTLREDIAKFLSASKENGAILFSLGTNFKDTQIKPDTLQFIFKVLSTLKQNVIWKWSNLDNTPGNATNILYKKWLPQDDILAHPNLKLFITHAGKGGTTEAIYHGVPMVAMPMFGDQPANAEKMATSGYGVVLDVASLTETEFRNAINEVLTNTSYATKVKAFSNLYRDRPLSAKESVVYWTEYVIRHKGARFMQSPLIHLNFIQSSSLDVYAAIAAIFYVVYKFLQVVLRTIRKLTFAMKSKKAKSD